MDLIYSSSFNLAALPAPSVLSDTESVIYASGVAVTGWAIVGTTGNVSVQASDDGFLSTTYDSGVISVTDTYLLAIGSVTADQWRVLAGSGGATVGYLYTGTHNTVSAPAYPYSFERDIIADSRRTLGGARYSVSRYTKRRGSWQFNGIQSAEAEIWRNAYSASNGWRKGVVVSPGGEIAIITADSDVLALKRNAPDAFTLRLVAEEVI